MKNLTYLVLLFVIFWAAESKAADDKNKIKRAIKDYIEAQIQVKPELMKRALHPQMKKRTFWRDKQDKAFLMETSVETMLKVAATYNKDGSRFSDTPKVKIDIYDIDQRVASAKLTVKDWIDYFHLMKDESGEWHVVNVLWQYHDVEKHKSKKN